MSDATTTLAAAQAAAASSSTASDAADFAAAKAVEVNTAKVAAQTAKTDAETARTDAQAAAAAAGAQMWVGGEAVTTATVRQAPDGSRIRSNAARTTRATFDATEQGFWTPVLSMAGTLEQVALTATIEAQGGSAKGVPRLDPTKKYRVITGTLRSDTAGTWYALDDAAHTPYGIDSVTVNGSGHLEVSYAGLAGTVVVFGSAFPDETLTASGFSIGASVAADKTTLKIYRDFPVQSGYVFYDTATSTWKRTSPSPFSSTFTYSTSTGKLIITHDTLPAEMALDVAAVARAGPYTVMIDSTTTSTVSLFFYDAATGAVVTGTPTANHRVYVRHGGGQRLLVNANDVTTALFPSSNIWFYAIVEVA